MYFVDTKKLNSHLDYFDQNIILTKKIKSDSEVDQLALERIVQVMIESVLDIGNMMIDGFIMRDPGSYLDIVHILIDEKVIPVEEKEAYEALISIRKDLVQNYADVNHDVLQNLMKENNHIFSNFTTHIRTYLANEMGVANTFK